MDKSLITEESIVLCLYNSTVAVNDNNIGVAVIEVVAIGESVIYIQYRMITDSIAGENIPSVVRENRKNNSASDKSDS